MQPAAQNLLAARPIFFSGSHDAPNQKRKPAKRHPQKLTQWRFLIRSPKSKRRHTPVCLAQIGTTQTLAANESTYCTPDRLLLFVGVVARRIWRKRVLGSPLMMAQPWPADRRSQAYPTKPPSVVPWVPRQHRYRYLRLGFHKDSAQVVMPSHHCPTCFTAAAALAQASPAPLVETTDAAPLQAPGLLERLCRPAPPQTGPSPARHSSAAAGSVRQRP